MAVPVNAIYDRTSVANSCAGETATNASPWSGGWESVLSMPYASVTVYDSGGGSGTLYIDYSADQTNYESRSQPIADVTAVLPHTRALESVYMRVRFVPAVGVTLSGLRVDTVLHAKPQSLSLSRLEDPIVATDKVTDTRAVISGVTPGGGYTLAKLSEEQALAVRIDEPIGAYDALMTESMRPIAQIDACAGIRDNVETFTDSSPGTGSATAVDAQFVVATGGGAGGYGVVRTLRPIRYRPGQGSMARFTAVFNSGVADSEQGAGIYNSVSGYFVGFTGTSFGVMHRTGGAHTIRVLTISAAGNGSETATVTLDGTAYAGISVTATTTAGAAYDIQVHFASIGAWDAWANGSTVTFFKTAVGTEAGSTYSLASDGTLAGTFADAVTTGTGNTENWTLQAAFNVDKLDGTGASGMTIDPTKGNVFEIMVEFLGYGAVTYKIENPTTGAMFTFHRHQFPNSRTAPTLVNPTMKVGWYVYSLGTTSNVVLKGASAMTAVLGNVVPLFRPRSTAATGTSVGTTEKVIFSLRNRSVFAGISQNADFFPRLLTVSNEISTGKGFITVRIRLDPAYASTPRPIWTYIDEANSIVEKDVTATALAGTPGGITVASFTLFSDTADRFTFDDISRGAFAYYVGRGSRLVFTAQTSTNTASVAMALTWTEE